MSDLETDRKATQNALKKANGCIIAAAEILDLEVVSMRHRVTRHKLGHLVVADSYVLQRPYQPALQKGQSASYLWESGIE